MNLYIYTAAQIIKINYFSQQRL